MRILAAELKVIVLLGEENVVSSPEAAPVVAALGRLSLFQNHFLRLFVISPTQERGLPQLVIRS
jgi:hypothetical protein